jgi:tRNA (guanine37-N1)-methyltransferase
MRAWSVVVPPDRAEDVRRELLSKDLLLKHLRIVQDRDRILLPTSHRVDLGFPTEERVFEEGFVAIRSYKDVIDIPEAFRSSLPRSFDVVGDVAVIRLPKEIRPHRSAVGEAILRWNPRLRVVLEDRGVAGLNRVRRVEGIAGEGRTTTVHVEHGLRYHVDLAHAYFSPRLAAERKRVADSIRDGETVADPFAGVGPYAILIARLRRPRVVYASDVNPVAVDLLRANAAMNRADRVDVREGEARAVLHQVAPVDRVILDLPHSALDFLPDAFAALGNVGTVHLYGILRRTDEAEREKAIRSHARAAGLRVKDLGCHHVRAYSPSQFHSAFDVTVARA